MKNRFDLPSDQLLKIEIYDSCPDLQLEFMDRIGSNQDDDLFIFHNNAQVGMDLEPYFEEQASLKVQDIENLHNSSKQKIFEDTFHKQSSSVIENNFNINQSQFPMEYLEKHLCLRSTPIQDIENFMQKDSVLSVFIKSPLSKKINKLILNKKRFLKRQKAKLRKQSVPCKIQEEIIPVKLDKQLIKLSQQTIKDSFNVQEDKKRRNRISAQVSRDKRKAYLTQLQESNKKLTDQKEQIAQENQKLKQQLQRLKNSNNTQAKQEKIFHKNKFVKVLIFMGIVFMINLFQDVIQKNYQNNTHSGIIIETEQTYSKENPILNPIIAEKLITKEFIEFQQQEQRVIVKQILSLLPNINTDETKPLLIRGLSQQKIQILVHDKSDNKELKEKKNKNKKKKQEINSKQYQQELSALHLPLYSIMAQMISDKSKVRQQMHIPIEVYSKIQQVLSLISG